MNYKTSYDPKYDGKPFFNSVGLRKIKHRVSFSGAIITCLVLYIISQSLRQAQNYKEDDDNDFPDWKRDNLRDVYLQEPVDLRPGYLPQPKGNSNQNQTAWIAFINKVQHKQAAALNRNKNVKENGKLAQILRHPQLPEENLEEEPKADARQLIGDDMNGVHDVNVLKDFYAARHKKPDGSAAEYANNYAQAGRQALIQHQQEKQMAALPGNGMLDSYMNGQLQVEKLLPPRPHEWPVRILKEPITTCFPGIKLLLLVHTHSSAFGARRAIRNSWGVQTAEKYPKLGNNSQWKTIFILGRSPTNQWEKEVSREEKEFGDMLQGDFEDNQLEGTRKFLLGMTWLAKVVNSGCEPMFIMKTEEYIYHNMHSIMSWLESKFTGSSMAVYMGKKLTRDLPVREAANPLYISWQQYSRTYFPDMIQGPQFLFDYISYLALSRQISFVTKLAMEEGYISLLAESAAIKPTHNEHFVLLKQPSNVCNMLRMFFISDAKPSEHTKIFKTTKESLTNGKCPNAHVIKPGNKHVNIEM